VHHYDHVKQQGGRSTDSTGPDWQQILANQPRRQVNRPCISVLLTHLVCTLLRSSITCELCCHNAYVYKRIAL
jgi:hypothetical protein